MNFTDGTLRVQKVLAAGYTAAFNFSCPPRVGIPESLNWRVHPQISTWDRPYALLNGVESLALLPQNTAPSLAGWD